MGKIKNIPSITDDPQVNVRRSDINQRAEWFYFMNQEAAKRGIDWEEYARPAIRQVGCYRGEQTVSQFKDRGSLRELLASHRDNELGTKTFEKEYIKDTDDEIIMHFHYCPLVAAWQKLTDDEELIAKCCDVAMEGDRGIFSLVEDSAFFLEGTIAEGKDYCRLRLVKQKND